MSFKTTLLAAIAAFSLALPAHADSDIEVHDAYAMASSTMATAGAAFMIVHNHGDTADRLLTVTSEAARLVQFHTHVIDANGVAKMEHVINGWEIPPGGEVLLERGGNHVMFMGLTAPFVDGDTVSVTLVFEHAGEIVVEVPVDLARMQMGDAMDHATMDHGDADASN